MENGEGGDPVDKEASIALSRVPREDRDISDAISSGSSFEILSVSDECEERVPAESAASLDEFVENKSSEVSRKERTKRYVMESEFGYVEDSESDSDHFINIRRTNERPNEPVTEPSEDSVSQSSFAEHTRIGEVEEAEPADECEERNVEADLMNDSTNKTLPAASGEEILGQEVVLNPESVRNGTSEMVLISPDEEIPTTETSNTNTVMDVIDEKVFVESNEELSGQDDTFNPGAVTSSTSDTVLVSSSEEITEQNVSHTDSMKDTIGEDVHAVSEEIQGQIVSDTDAVEDTIGEGSCAVSEEIPVQIVSDTDTTEDTIGEGVHSVSEEIPLQIVSDTDTAIEDTIGEGAPAVSEEIPVQIVSNSNVMEDTIDENMLGVYEEVPVQIGSDSDVMEETIAVSEEIPVQIVSDTGEMKDTIGENMLAVSEEMPVQIVSDTGEMKDTIGEGARGVSDEIPVQVVSDTDAAMEDTIGETTHAVIEEIPLRIGSDTTKDTSGGNAPAVSEENISTENVYEPDTMTDNVEEVSPVPDEELTGQAGGTATSTALELLIIDLLKHGSKKLLEIAMILAILCTILTIVCALCFVIVVPWTHQKTLAVMKNDLAACRNERDHLQNECCFKEVLHSAKNNSSAPNCISDEYLFKAKHVWQLVEEVQKAYVEKDAILTELRGMVFKLTNDVETLTDRNKQLEFLLNQKDGELPDHQMEVDRQARRSDPWENKNKDKMNQDQSSSSNAANSVNESVELVSRKFAALFTDVLSLVKEVHENLTFNRQKNSHPGNTSIPVSVFVSFLEKLIETSAVSSSAESSQKVAMLEIYLQAMNRCIDSLQLYTPNLSVSDIFGLNWLQVQKAIANKPGPGASEKLMPTVCQIFVNDLIEKEIRKSMERETEKKDESKTNYISQTLAAFNKISDKVKSNLEKIKKLPKKYLGGNKMAGSFGERFMKTISGISNRFSKGYAKLRDKIDRGVKESVSKLSRRVKSGWEKLRNKMAKPKHDKKSVAEEIEDELSYKIKDDRKEEVMLDGTETTKENHKADFTEPKTEDHKRADETSDKLKKFDVQYFQREMEALNAKGRRALVMLSYAILESTDIRIHAMDRVVRRLVLKELVAVAEDGKESYSVWVSNWVKCQREWWALTVNCFPFEMVDSCGSWMADWQRTAFPQWARHQGKYCIGAKETAQTRFENIYSESLNLQNWLGMFKHENFNEKESVDDDVEPSVKGDRGSDWYFRRINDRESLFTDPDWYFSMMEDRESNRHDAEWYFRNNDDHSVSGAPEQRGRPSRRNYRGR